MAAGRVGPVVGSAREVLAGRDRVAVACACGWDAGGGLVLFDRWRWDWPPIPYVELFEFYSAEGGDPDDRVWSCPECDAELEDACVERGS